MTSKTAQQWREILIKCKVAPSVADRWALAFSQAINDTTFSAGSCEMDDFLGQVLHESAGLSRMEENLNYSARRIEEIGNAASPSSRWRALVPRATELANNPVAFANACYGGRLGNNLSGDGFKYRGSSLIMVTGRANFASLQQATGIPLVDNPDLLRRPGVEALRVCIAWWEANVPDSVMGDVVKVTRAVNGGAIGLDDRTRLAALAMGALA